MGLSVEAQVAHPFWVMSGPQNHHTKLGTGVKEPSWKTYLMSCRMDFRDPRMACTFSKIMKCLKFRLNSATCDKKKVVAQSSYWYPDCRGGSSSLHLNTSLISPVRSSFKPRRPPATQTPCRRNHLPKRMHETQWSQNPNRWSVGPGMENRL